MSFKKKLTVFTFFLKYTILCDIDYTYLYFYNKNYILCIRAIKQSIKVSINNQYFLNFFFLNFNLNYQIPNLEKKLNNTIKQFCIYNNLKIKFTGKGYKIKKVSTNSFIFVFNRAHILLLYYKNIFLKKIKKRKIHMKYIGFLLKNQINPIFKEIRYVNTYTRRGLRLSKQVIYKRRGKRT